MTAFKNIDGMAELDAALKALPINMERNVVRGGLRAGVGVFRRIARENVPVADGDLRRSIRISTSQTPEDRRRGMPVVRLVAGDRKAFYAHMVEFGTAAHKIAPKTKEALTVGDRVVADVEHPGTPEKPYMRPALDTGQQGAIAAMRDYIAARLAKVVKK